jgi:hypothetical protein
MLKQSPEKDFNYFKDSKSLNGLQNQMYIESTRRTIEIVLFLYQKKRPSSLKAFFYGINQWIKTKIQSNLRFLPLVLYPTDSMNACLRY